MSYWTRELGKSVDIRRIRDTMGRNLKAILTVSLSLQSSLFAASNNEASEMIQTKLRSMPPQQPLQRPRPTQRRFLARAQEHLPPIQPSGVAPLISGYLGIVCGFIPCTLLFNFIELSNDDRRVACAMASAVSNLLHKVYRKIPTKYQNDTWFWRSWLASSAITASIAYCVSIYSPINKC